MHVWGSFLIGFHAGSSGFRGPNDGALSLEMSSLGTDQHHHTLRKSIHGTVILDPVPPDLLICSAREMRWVILSDDLCQCRRTAGLGG